ncbi:LacI family DNA-binding transcriptional regulator [Streptomyces sp. NPDC004237]|uniref:LacI family DNA-binding transcriptional regulator n=1 Tax=Streptomyces sp. NPDC004237 TaxID=3154455 RepID=UPI0033A2A7FB
MKANNARPAGVTLADVAAAAGVDRSTASRALRGDVRRVSATTIARVRATAQELGYRPDLTAAALRSGQSRMLGVLVPSITDAAMAALFAGIEDEARAAGYLAVVTSTASEDASRQTAVDAFLGRKVDGLIVADSLIDQPLPATGTGGSVPIVAAFRQGPPSHPSVVADEYAGGRAVAEHLAAQGHRDLVVLGDPAAVPTFHTRIQGFRAGIRELLGNSARVDVVPAGLQVNDGYTAMARALGERKSPTAVFAINDYSAIGAAHALQEHGLLPGSGIGLVGYNDDPIAAHLPVPLSSVSIDVRELGRQGARTLIGLIENTAAEPAAITPRLIPRASSATPADNLTRPPVS